MSRILFSPIGGSDPIRNFSDGSMLHICRNYLPDKVYLYLSYEMFEHHKKDNRYLYCINQLGEKLGHNFEVKLIIREKLKNVQNHEVFYNDFRNCIADIEREMAPEDELLLNISSGTPAMKNALIVLSTLAEFPFRSVQVSTPLKSSNRTDEDIDNYEVEEQWECNVDNESGQESRCEEVHSLNLSALLKINIIKQHLKSYDYAAAYQVAEGMEGQLSEKCLLYLEQAKERVKLNTYRVNQIAKETGYHPMPVRKDEDRVVVEYLLSLQLKEKRQNYDDFIRGVTPIIVKLLERTLKKQCHIDIMDYCTLKNDVLSWDQNKINGSTVLTALNNIYNQNFKVGPISSVHLKNLICEFSVNKGLNVLAENLRHVEEEARNRAAHTMVSITQDRIKKWTGFGSSDIIKMLQELTIFVGAVDDATVWDSYDEMNAQIIKVLDESVKLAV